MHSGIAPLHPKRLGAHHPRLPDPYIHPYITTTSHLPNTTSPEIPHLTMSLVPRTRILDLLKVQCRIFNTTFNPTGQRLGNKVLRQRLRGPALATYYPRRVATFVNLKRMYPGYEMYDDFEEDRLEHLQIAKSRGKGAPKKKNSKNGEFFFVGHDWEERRRG